ncbi:hypothetical protein [Kribbella sp. NPDC004875]|uniref:hypothetical protein n=1 Tax=Kribbella sp. NPDC004875 TaxID=3364107 RepID=UPI0036759BF6
MTDTETRLRDYLTSQAATVPDDAQGPGLDSTRRRRHWPVVAAAAAIAVVAVLAASFLSRSSGNDTAPARTPAPPVSGAAPELPYMNPETSTLHDGKQTVKLPKGFANSYFERVAGGWMGIRMAKPGEFRTGVLQPNGTFRPLGPERSDQSTLSPDRKLVALWHYLSNTKGQVIVVDVRSGRQVAQLPAGSLHPDIVGWNQDGLWMTTGKAELIVWKPSTGAKRTVSIPGFDGSASVPKAAATIAVSAKAGGKQCVRAGVLREDGFKVLREYCAEGQPHLYPVLSPDGRTMVQSFAGVAIDVNTGQVTKLQVPNHMLDVLPEPAFENGTQLLTLNESQDGNRLSYDLWRCDVTSGACKQLIKKADGFSFVQH